MKDREIYIKAIEYWGVNFQFDMIVEECAELIHAIQKLKRNKNQETINNVINEGVDVSIMINQLRIIMYKLDDIKIPSTWCNIHDKKLRRLEKMIINK